MPISAKQIANWFIDKEPMTKKKLQILCYYAQAWSYTLHDEPMIDGEFVTSFHGPKCYELDDYVFFKDSEKIISPKVNELLESVWFTYGGETENALEALSKTELPYQLAKVSGKTDSVISPEIMKTYFSKIRCD